VKRKISKKTVILVAGIQERIPVDRIEEGNERNERTDPK